MTVRKMLTGDIIEIEIESVHGFGFFGRHEGYSVLVPVPETSWIASCCSCKQFAAPGDSVRVKILYVNQEERKARASIKALYSDPWQDPNKLVAGSTVQATIVRRVENADRCGGQPGYLVAIEPGAYAMLCDPRANRKPGDKCSVRLAAVRPERRFLELELATE
jgi:predicted RNA-binding protein with RPS1 domain